MSTSLEAIAPPRVSELIAEEEARFREKRRRSHELWEQARRLIPRGVPSSFQDAAPQPVFIDHGKGSRIWDVDGNEYVDFHNGFGVMLVGHAHPLILQAINEQAAKGTHFAQPVADVAIVAEELLRRFHQPQWRFTNSGTESTLDAVRLARGFTGRDRLITIEAGGATERFGVTPDLVALAKAIGGGLPCGAVGGRADVMSTIDEHKVVQIGTFNGNPLTIAASKATLTKVLTPQAYAHFDALAEALEGGLRKVIDDYQLPFHPITLAARGCVTYRKERVRNYRDYLTIDKKYAYLSWLYQCNRGVLMAPGAEENWTLSVLHS